MDSCGHLLFKRHHVPRSPGLVRRHLASGNIRLSSVRAIFFGSCARSKPTLRCNLVPARTSAGRTYGGFLMTRPPDGGPDSDCSLAIQLQHSASVLSLN
jgi:hypothetical protein